MKDQDIFISNFLPCWPKSSGQKPQVDVAWCSPTPRRGEWKGKRWRQAARGKSIRGKGVRKGPVQRKERGESGSGVTYAKFFFSVASSHSSSHSRLFLLPSSLITSAALLNICLQRVTIIHFQSILIDSNLACSRPRSFTPLTIAVGFVGKQESFSQGIGGVQTGFWGWGCRWVQTGW
jgi:hypothetical protein